MQAHVVGVDLGGTNVRSALFDANGNILCRDERPSRAQDGVDHVVDAIVSSVQSVGGEPACVGLAVPGYIRADTGTVVWAPNFGIEVNGVFRYWEDVPLGQMLEQRLGCRTVIGNDANCAALGEYWHGSGKGNANCMVLITLGTGVGGGVVMSPRSVSGKATGPLVLLGGNQGGAELGHLRLSMDGLDCNAGSYGALEAYCQRDAIVTRAQHKVRRYGSEVLSRLCGGDLGRMTPKIVAEAAEAGDDAALATLSETGRYLGAAIGSFINIFAPDILAVGGQIAKAGEFLLCPARDEAKNVAIPSLFRDCQIVPAEQADDAGLLGAGRLAMADTQ